MEKKKKKKKKNYFQVIVTHVHKQQDKNILKMIHEEFLFVPYVNISIINSKFFFLKKTLKI